MDLELSGKRAIISGSTAGIGLAIASRLALEGAEVIVSGRTKPRVDEALQQIERAAPGASAWGVAADLSTKAGAREVIERVPDVDILVNNLGVYSMRPFPEIDDAEWETIFQANVFSGVRLSRHYLPRMLARNSGHVIFISSESAVNIPVEMIHYGVTKTAQAALARGLAELTAGTNVTVNSVLAGPTHSQGVDTALESAARSRGISVEEIERRFLATSRPTSLLKRIARAEEVAAVVAFIASPLASTINGAAVRAEGGVLRSVF
jgi:NAD(P)-dependent dehydrogenase (short-subunit alcohol dehydrogenase family)